MIRKPFKVRSKAIRKAAKGEACTLNLYCCNHDPETTVFAHLPSDGKGIATKSSDLWGVFACAACHDALDGRGVYRADDADILRALYRTLHRLVEKGVITVEG